MTRKDIIDTEVRTPTQNAKTFLLTLCAIFTAVMVICMVFATIFANEESRQGILYSWSILGACVCAAALQFVFFTPIIIKRMTYALRLLLFGLCLYAVLVTLAITMSWFPVEMLGAWVSFTVTYLIMLAAATAIFAVKHKRQERILNEKLNEYRKGSAS